MSSSNTKRDYRPKRQVDQQSISEELKQKLKERLQKRWEIDPKTVADRIWTKSPEPPSYEESSEEEEDIKSSSSDEEQPKKKRKPSPDTEEDKSESEPEQIQIGPKPLPISSKPVESKGEGKTMADNERNKKIEKFEELGYVMSGDRYKRMRKEDQVIEAEQNKSTLVSQHEERVKRENMIIAQFKEMIKQKQSKS